MSNFTPLENFAIFVHASRRPRKRSNVSGEKTITWYVVWGFVAFFTLDLILNVVAMSFNP